MPQDTLVNRVFRTNGLLETQPETYLLGLRGESIVSYRSRMNGGEISLGIKTAGKTWIRLHHKTGLSEGTWQDQDRHDPGLTRDGKDYSLPGTLKEWANYYAQLNGSYNRSALSFSRTLLETDSLALDVSLGYSRAKYRYTIQAPLYSFVEFSELKNEPVYSLSLKTSIQTDALDLEFRLRWKVFRYLNLFGGVSGSYGQRVLKREWKNRGIVSNATLMGGGGSVHYGATLILFSPAHRLEVGRRLENSRSLTKKPDHVLGIPYGSKGETLKIQRREIYMKYVYRLGE